MVERTAQAAVKRSASSAPDIVVLNAASMKTSGARICRRLKASFDGIIDRLHHQQGSLGQEGEILTTMSDNSAMWVYFNVPEARYLQYMDDVKNNKEIGRASCRARV